MYFDCFGSLRCCVFVLFVCVLLAFVVFLCLCVCCLCLCLRACLQLFVFGSLFLFCMACFIEIMLSFLSLKRACFVFVVFC